MKLLITRPVVLTGDGGVRSFVPGLTVDVDAGRTTRSSGATSSGQPAR